MEGNCLLTEVLWHGRGGQGVVVASSILGTALTIYEGKYALCIPSFGVQRRDAPLIAVTRISQTPIRRRQLAVDPDYVVILDDSLTATAINNLGHEKFRHIIVNSTKLVTELGISSWQNTIIDAQKIALEVTGRPIVNSVMTGVLAAVTGLVKIESIIRAIADVVPPGFVEKNIAAAEAGFGAFRR